MSFGGVDEAKLVAEIQKQIVPALEQFAKDQLDQAKLTAILTDAIKAALVGRKFSVSIE